VARKFAETKQDANLQDNQENEIIEAAAKKLGVPIK
jgi:hypothetical protein